MYDERKGNSETEVITERKSFEDIDVNKYHYIEYETYKEVPANSDFSYGKESSIVLRNKMTGQLERIQFVFCGYSHTPRLVMKACISGIGVILKRMVQMDTWYSTLIRVESLKRYL